jgi:hypothetical protein
MARKTTSILPRDTFTAVRGNMEYSTVLIKELWNLAKEF